METCILQADTYILKPRDRLVDIPRRVLIQLLIMPKDDDRDIDRAQHGKLMRFLEQAALALQKSDGPAQQER